MSVFGKLGLSLSALSLIIMVSTRFILGGWLNVLYIFLFLFLLGIVLALIIDYKVYLSFLLMKTTKNGMSMGVSVLITLVFCASLAYLSTRFEKSIDITEEKINSLSPQTVQLLDKLEEDMDIIVFYKGRSGSQKKDLLKRNLLLFKQESRKLRVRYYDAYLENQKAQEYLNEFDGKENEDIFVFVQHKGKKVLADMPFDEEKLTSAMIKVTRREEKTIYFLSGHGEKEWDDQTGEGLAELKTALTRSSFKTQAWSFVRDGALPKDVSALVIAGPRLPYLEKEMEWLSQYLQNGGRLLMALDPDKNHGLKKWLLQFNVDYRGHYVMDRVSAGMGLGPFSPLGFHFDSESAVTKSFKRGYFSVFHIAGALRKAEDSNDKFSVTELVKTNAYALSVPDMKSKTGDRSSHALALLVEENPPTEDSEKDSADTKNKDTDNKLSKDKKNLNSMQLAVFGDSDFLSNSFIKMGVNRDLALNTISYLADESDLVSIRPKKLKATKLVLKKFDQAGTIGFAVLLPIICFICSFVIWLRRREA